MELNVVELVVQAGALGLVVLLLFLMSKMFSRMVDCLEMNAKNQEKTAGNLDSLSERVAEQGRISSVLAESVRVLTENIRALTAEVGADKVEAEASDASVAKVLGKLLHQMDSHEARTVTRWEQQSEQAAERHAELMRAMKEIVGKG